MGCLVVNAERREELQVSAGLVCGTVYTISVMSPLMLGGRILWLGGGAVGVKEEKVKRG